MCSGDSLQALRVGALQRLPSRSLCLFLSQESPSPVGLKPLGVPTPTFVHLPAVRIPEGHPTCVLLILIEYSSLWGL